MKVIFILPILSGIGLLTGSFLLFRRERLNAKNFAIAIILSSLVTISPGIYIFLDAVKDLLGFVYTFVLGFGLAILFLIALVVYLILSIGALRNETDAMWQEIALIRAELENDHKERSSTEAELDD